MNELFTTSATGLTLYSLVLYNSQVWNTSTLAFEDALSANWADYAIPMVEEDESGFYVADFPVGITSAAVYPYEVRIQSGGSPVQADQAIAFGQVQWQGEFEVQGGVYIISLAEYKNFYNITNNNYDVQITSIIPAISDEIDTYLNWNVIFNNYQEVYNGTGNRFIRLNNLPITSLTSVTFDVQGTNPTVVDGSNFVFQSLPALVQWKETAINLFASSFPHGFQNLQFNYSAGYDSAFVPQQIKRAAALMTNRFLTQTQPKFLTNSKTVGDVVIQQGHNFIDMNDQIYADAKRILNNWKTVRIIF